jgi:two-component system, LuxR family, response regulator FixJ
MSHAPTIFIVDDDYSIQRSLRFLLATARLTTEAYKSVEEFLSMVDPHRPGCLLLDVKMPGVSGLELLERLRDQAIAIPTVMMSGFADTTSVVRAMRAGAMDFLEKPFDDDRLIGCVSKALQHDQFLREERQSRDFLQKRIESLTPREQQTMELISRGATTKQIAAKLGISTKTVDVHRTRVLEKMEVTNAVELALLLERKRESDSHS